APHRRSNMRRSSQHPSQPRQAQPIRRPAATASPPPPPDRNHAESSHQAPEEERVPRGRSNGSAWVNKISHRWRRRVLLYSQLSSLNSRRPARLLSKAFGVGTSDWLGTKLLPT